MHFNPRSPWGATAKMHNDCWASLAKITNFLRDFHFLGIKSQQRPAKTAFIRQKNGVNLPEISVCFRFALQNQSILRQIGVLAAEMLNLLFVLIAQIVETQAVLFRVHNGQKLYSSTSHCPDAPSWAEQTLTPRVMNRSPRLS